MIRCLHCSAETGNGLALCDLCRRAASDCLAFIPIYTRNLSRWRPGRAGSRAVPGSREPRNISVSTAGDRVARALDETGSDLTTWARQLEDARGIATPDGLDEAEQAEAICGLLAEHLTSIATTDWCGELVTGLQSIERRLSTLTMQVVPGWYAGECGQPVGFDDEGAAIRCPSRVYVVPGLTWVTCANCGVTTAARDHLPALVNEARDWVAPPKRIAEALVPLLDSEPSVPRLYERIKKWEQRAQVPSVRRFDGDGDPIGPKRVRLGDVLDRLASEGQTRTSGKSAAAS